MVIPLGNEREEPIPSSSSVLIFRLFCEQGQGRKEGDPKTVETEGETTRHMGVVPPPETTLTETDGGVIKTVVGRVRHS